MLGKGKMKMRHSAKGKITTNPVNQLFGIDFHDLIQQENTSAYMEIQEFGVSLQTVKNFKKKMERN